MMDPIELDLYNKKIDAEHDYINYLRENKLETFKSDTKDYVWDKYHWYYKYIFPEEDSDIFNIYESDKKQTDVASNYFKKLSVICHPDKCAENWAHQIFIKATNAYKNNDIKSLESMYLHWELYKSFNNYNSSINDKTEDIKKWKSELWYLWYYGEDIYKDVFIPPKIMSERQNKLIQENEKMKDKLEQLQDKDVLFKENEKIRDKLRDELGY
jgi:hypothetical protein